MTYALCVVANQLVRYLGLTAEDWLRKVRDNEVFAAGEVVEIEKRLLPEMRDLRLPLAGERYGDWGAKNCGLLRLLKVDEEVPIPFAPVMAGILLAGEVLKEHLFPDAILDSYY